MSKSFRGALNGIGEPGADGLYPRWPGDFHWSPPRMSEVIRLLRHPQVAAWTKPNEWEFANEDWTEECQGVTSDGTHWYLCSNKCGWGLEPERRAIYKFDASMNLIAHHRLGPFLRANFGNVVCEGVHVGDIDWYQSIIYIPVENPMGLIALSDDFGSTSKHRLLGTNGGAPPQTHFSWCAVNPLNGLLYSSDFDNVNRVFAYEPGTNYKHVATLKLPFKTHQVQGGCFSPEGKLYLASNTSHDIRGFSSLTGAYLGSASIQVEDDDQEVEGICYWKTTTNGTPTQVHVILLENEDLSSDDIWLKHYASPVPNLV
ncbi:MAG: hypothetical protein WBO54_05680 [Thermoanaerobaculia bacterium]